MVRTLKSCLFFIGVLLTMTANAGFVKGMIASDNGDYETAFIEFSSVEEGDFDYPHAQGMIGSLYYFGALPRNYEKAFIHSKIAAEAGQEASQLLLGKMYMLGRGIEKNDAQSAMWFERAASQGEAMSQMFLAAAYSVGRGVEKNTLTAANWAHKSAEQGNEGSMFLLGGLYRNGGDGLDVDYKKAVKWFRLAADQGNSNAQAELASMYFGGEGVLQDYEEAFKWFKRAAEQGDDSAQGKLGIMYMTGSGISKDLVRAHMWLNLARYNGWQAPGGRNLRDEVAQELTAYDLMKAQRLAKGCLERNYQECFD